MEGTIRKNITPGASVSIVEKENQRTGQITKGVVKEILTNSARHPHNHFEKYYEFVVRKP
ncbi:MAG: YwbE family protein [Promethearchaeota archaeon]|nr:MAG: YwbE family protein [Candidatus Lokiarchaeota archaeon]